MDEIQVFVRVVEAESFTAAADQLGMPKSTVSRYVTKLEDRLGVRLLNRSTRQLQTTDVGRSYYARCAALLAELSEVERSITSMQEVPSGPLRVTAPLTFGYLFFGEIVSEFLQQYPDVQLMLSLTDRKVNLIEEGFDVAIRGGVLEDSSLVARKLTSTNRVICASPAYLAQRGTPQHPDALKQHACLSYSSGPALGSAWRMADDSLVPVQGPLTVNNLEVLRRAALAGLGLILTPRFMVSDDLAAGRLVAVLESHTSHQGGLYVLYPHARHVSAKVRAFVDFVVAHVQASGGTLRLPKRPHGDSTHDPDDADHGI